MKISPVADLGTTVGAITGGPEHQTMGQKIRALRMSTNATPGRVDDPNAQNLNIPANSDTTSAAAEDIKPLSPQYAAIARQRRALQVKEREIADRERALATKTPADGSSVDVARLKTDPLGVLLEAGVTYDQLTQAVLASQDGAPIRALEAKIKALEEGVDKKLTDRDAQGKQQALAEMQREAVQLIAQGEAYELVRETKSVPQVMSLIEKTYDTTGEVLDVREALKLVEDELIKDSLKLAKLQKVQSQLVPQPVPQAQPARQMRTLTNRDTASVPMSAKARAIAAFNGTLRK